MDRLPDPFPSAEPDPTVTYARALPTAALMERYAGEYVVVRAVGEAFEVVAHGDDLAATLASPGRREGDVSLRVPREHEERI